MRVWFFVILLEGGFRGGCGKYFGVEVVVVEVEEREKERKGGEGGSLFVIG